MITWSLVQVMQLEGKNFLKIIDGEDFRFGDVKFKKYFLIPVNNRLNANTNFITHFDKIATNNKKKSTRFMYKPRIFQEEQRAKHF